MKDFGKSHALLPSRGNSRLLSHHQTLLAMKMTIILLTVGLLNVHAGGFSQTVALSGTNIPLKKVFSEIKKQTGYTFFYNYDLLKSARPVTINVKDAPLADVLNQCFSDQPLSYYIQNRTVFVTEKTTLPPAGENNLPRHVEAVISGTVVSATNGAAIAGASVVIKGTKRGATTDASGHFEIKADPGEILVISAIGYAPFNQTIGSSAEPLSITLQEQTSQLNDVVVTALGIKRDPRSLGYSDQKIAGADIIKGDPPNLAQGLMGKSAGLNISVPNGVEGSSTRIVIRGNNSLLGNNQPLIVVDGVMIDNEPILPQGQNLTTQNLLGQNTDVNSSQVTDYGSFLNTINPDDFESVNVLKGPTAAALYGARGANGVLLLTSKKGSREKGLGLNYNFSARWNDPYRFMQLQDEYGMGMTETLYSATPSFYKDGGGNDREMSSNDFYGPHSVVPGGTNFWNYIGFPGDGASWGPKMSGQPLTWWDGVTRPYTGNPNIFKSFYKPGHTITHNVSFAGGGDLGTLRVSYTRTDNDAITYNSNFSQNVFNIGSSINVSKKVKVEATATYTNLNRLNAPNLLGEGQSSSGIGYVTDYNLPMDYKPLEKALAVNKDGSQNQTVINSSPSQDNASIPWYWWNTLKNNTTFTHDQLMGSLKLTADLLPWLSVMGHAGLDHFTNQFENDNTPTDAAGIHGTYANDLATISTTNLDA
ncbi:MAG TPA: carboxypeptidase-like regulatory domain-containing protein, partial [Chitinophagaceae bacterium]